MAPPNSQPPQESTQQQIRKKRLKKRIQEFSTQWQQLYELCRDQESRNRLTELREQFERQKRGVSEPAQAEVEAAHLLWQVGFSIAFLQESDARTADLECWLGNDRLFVEITAIIPNPPARRRCYVPNRDLHDKQLVHADEHVEL